LYSHRTDQGYTKDAEANPNMTKSNTDILMSIKSEHMQNIASGAKNHEYRGYLLPQRIRRIWFYTTSPVQKIVYVAQISLGKVPGEVPENGGIGNTEFNEAKKKSTYAYEIVQLWMLKQPITLQQAIARKYLKGAPQKYCWVPLSLVGDYPLNKQNQVIFKTSTKPSEPSRESSEDTPTAEAKNERGSKV
jgi:predicted transcriptional regulator